ncbi:MAG: homoserine dehydrogenase, partial [Burkholderiales bacterium]|nr:homoserine dehydrogenase [Burkholderiales bacterium]
MKPIKVGLLGLGTVGSGTFNVLKRNQEEIMRRAGRSIEITMVAVRNVERAREITKGEVEIVTDGNLVVNHPDIDIVIELIGGSGIAKDL